MDAAGSLERVVPFLSCVELAAAIRRCEISSRQALDILLRRAESIDRALNAIVVLDVARARERADEADAALKAGTLWGPLHGVPCTIKESHDVAGLPTSIGVREWKDRIARENAVSTQRIVAAGAVIFGKTNVPTAAMDVQCFNPVYGSTSNPWDLCRTPGGSSGGAAAAIAAGMTPFDIGSDVGGSIRVPAAFCGIYGHRPTLGIIPISGETQPRFSKECLVSGPMARTPEDLRLLMDILVGPDDRITSRGWALRLPEPRKSSLKDYRVAVWADAPWAPVDDSLIAGADAVVQALRAVGAHVDVIVKADFFDVKKNLGVYVQLTSVNSIISGLPLPKGASLEGYRQAQEDREALRDGWEAFFDEYDVMICPSYPCPAFMKLETEPNFRKRVLDIQREGVSTKLPYLQALQWAYLTLTANLPSTTFPCGLCKTSGLPLGLNVVSREYNDLICIDVARLLRTECGFQFQPPPEEVALSGSRSRL